MGWFNKVFRGRKSDEPKEKNEINQGIGYMYMIMGLQVVFVLAILGIMLFIGKVISTPWWVFAALFIGAITGCVYIYRKAKKKWNAFKNVIQNLDLSDKNYEISIMGGMLTMRVEQNPRRMLEASSHSVTRPLPPASSEEPVSENSQSVAK